MRARKYCNSTTARKKANQNYISLKIGNVSVDILIDSGSSRSLISENTAKALKLKIDPLSTSDHPSLFAANSSRLRIIGSTVVSVFLKGLTIYQTVYVATQLNPEILFGGDFLSENAAVINYRLGILSLHDDLIQIPMHSPYDENNCVTLAKTICIPALTEVILTVNNPAKFNNKSVLLETLPRMNPLKVVVAKALVSCRNNQTVCRLLNYNNHVVTLKKGLSLAKIETFDTIDSIREYKEVQTVTSDQNLGIKPSLNELNEFHKDYGFKISPSLQEDQRRQILEMLHRYKHVFARDVTEIKACKGPPLKIDLHTHRKMFRRQFKLNEADKQEMTRQILQMEEAGVIEPSQDPYYNSPAFLVVKKTGQKRLVIDLRGINSLIMPKSVQLPKIDELLQNITSKNPIYLTCIDINSAFWQLSLDKDSRKYTSFTSPDGRRFQFKRCPFGLSTSPSQLVLRFLRLWF